MTFQDIAARLNKIRSDKGWTHEDIGVRSGIHKHQVWRVMAGKMDNPTLMTVIRIVEAMDMTMGDFFAYDRSADGADPTGQIRTSVRRLIDAVGLTPADILKDDVPAAKAGRKAKKSEASL